MLLTTIFYKVLFLVAISILGFLLGKKSDVEAYSISKILVYIVAPIVIFFLVVSKDFSPKYLLLSIGSFLLCSLMSVSALKLGGKIWSGGNKNLFAFSGGTGNTGYFGLPVVIYSLGYEAGVIAAFIILGVTLYEFTVGYYITAQGQHDKKDGLIKMLKLPLIYAFGLAFGLSYFGIKPSDSLTESFSIFTGTYSVLGMMVIGITLAKVKIQHIDWQFVVLANLWKYLVYPLIGFVLISLFAGQLNTLEQAVVMVMCCVPMAGNTVVLANELNVHPDKAAVAVMISTVLSIALIPLYLFVFRVV
ncbi:AEC family transporter [Psychrobacter pygoscelis]|uniref:AEC family transporter n=1 Tax=Psychrobacter pygoscelis TaxID=2488563 RepID=UPI00103C6A9A|nr:AEC family transporter [Psychrobacter pygoscelis]